MNSTARSALLTQICEYVAEEAAQKGMLFPVFAGLYFGSRRWRLRTAAQRVRRLLPFALAVSEEEGGIAPLSEAQLAVGLRRKRIAYGQALIARMEARLPAMSPQRRESAEKTLEAIRRTVARMQSGEPLPKEEKTPRSEESRKRERQMAGVLSQQIADAQKSGIAVFSRRGN